MPNTYTQIFVQLVFAVQGRQNFIPKEQRERLQEYITAALHQDGHKMLSLFCMPDHLHILVAINPQLPVAGIVLDLKRTTAQFIYEKGIVKNPFNWQKGYGAFSHSKSQVPDVMQYILKQEQQHFKKTFRQEYLEFLNKFGIPFEENFLFEFYE